MEIHIGDRIADITLVGKEGNKVQLTIDGKPYEVDIVMAENGSCSILHNGNSFNAGLVRGEGGKSYDISMLQRSIPVKVGDRLAAGDIAVVLEAMKMQSNYKVNADCIVRNILVSEGEPVNANQVLIELELIKGE